MTPEPLVNAGSFDRLRHRSSDLLAQLATRVEHGDIRPTPELAAKVLRHCSGILHALETCVVMPQLMSSSGS